MVKKLDPTRLVNNASGWTDRGVGDVNDMHKYPGPGSPEPEANRAAVLGEFGGLGLPVRGHTWQSEKNWGYRSFTDSEALTTAYIDLVAKLFPLIDEKGLVRRRLHADHRCRDRGQRPDDLRPRAGEDGLEARWPQPIAASSRRGPG